MLLFGLLLVGCSSLSEPAQGTAPATVNIEQDGQEQVPEILQLPDLAAVNLNGAPLKVVATTSIIGDVVAQVGGDAIELTTLIAPGQDSHSFEPGAQALASVAGAHVIFVNGWDLEEALVRDLDEIAGDAPVVPISANIAPLAAGDAEHEGEDGQEHSSADPHVWFSVQNVRQWVANVAQALGALDSANRDLYESNAAAYLLELDALAEYTPSALAQIPAERRFLVTTHDSFSYFARDYGFTVLGTVIPGASTLAEPSAGDLAGLIAAMTEHAVCAIFTETTTGSTLAQTVSAELEGCEEVRVLPLYTESIGPAGSGADSYIGMFRANVDSIVAGLGD
jgi:ABC-type Zn uptake system ZnuABC Zn-binding protein ZnuA